MAPISESIEINRRPEDVFAYLDDVKRHAEWQEQIVDVQPEGDQPMGVGKRIREIGRLIGMDESQIIPFSAITGEGRDELAGAIISLIGQPSWREETSDVDSGQFGTTTDAQER